MHLKWYKDYLHFRGENSLIYEVTHSLLFKVCLIIQIIAAYHSHLIHSFKTFLLSSYIKYFFQEFIDLIDFLFKHTKFSLSATSNDLFLNHDVWLLLTRLFSGFGHYQLSIYSGTEWNLRVWFAVRETRVWT